MILRRGGSISPTRRKHSTLAKKERRAYTGVGLFCSGSNSAFETNRFFVELKFLLVGQNLNHEQSVFVLGQEAFDSIR